MIDIEKCLANVYHMALVLASAYIAAHPQEYGWLIPVLQFYGQTLPPPNFEPRLRIEPVPTK